MMDSIIQSMIEFGVAGLMGLLWVWERGHSRRRERELSEAHGVLMRRDQQLNAMIRLIRHNTRAAVSLERTQQRMCDLLEGIRRDLPKTS